MRRTATRLTDRIGALARPSGQHEGVRRVAARLTTQTIALVLVMVIVLEGVVYVITQQALLGSLETTLRTRAGQADPAVCNAFHLSCSRPIGGGNPGGNAGGPPRGGQAGRGSGSPPGPGGGGPRGGSGFGSFAPISGPSDASAAYVDLHLQLVHADGVLGATVLAPDAILQVLSSGHSQCCGIRAYKGQDYLVYTAPIRSGGSIAGAVQTSISEHQYEDTMGSLLTALIVVALLGLLGSAGVSVVLVRRALRPIRVAMQRQQDFVADAAHELRTPLAIQRTVAEIGTAEPSIEELQGTVEQMLGENRHLTRLVEDLSLLARSDTDTVTIDRSPVDLSRLLTQTTDEIRYLASETTVALDADVESGIDTMGDVLRLRQLFLVLLDNALKHTPPGGTIHVRLAAEGGQARLGQTRLGHARLEVADSGEGIATSDLPHIFDRFYRADEARTGEGTGLGLAIAKWIVETHGGHIVAGNVAPHGARFTVILPLTRAPLPV